MKLVYDNKSDALFVRFSEDKIVDSEEARPGMIVDFDKNGHIVAIELLNARDKLAPNAIAALRAAE
jgi:uncharacterized protein YuzE